MAEKARKLTTFVWEGRDNRGRKVKGENDAPSVAYVNATLRRQGIRPTKVKKQSRPLFSIGKRVKAKDVTIFTRQLSTMIAAGIPIAQALDAIGRGHDNAAVKELLNKLRTDVEAGTNLSEAMARYPHHFDDLFISLVTAGEQSGTLDILLEKIASYKERIEAIKGKIKSAMFYPASILLVAVVVIALLLIFVIPQFETLFQNFGGDLPTLTRAIVDLSRFTQQWWWAMAAVLIGVIVGITFLYKRSAKLRHFVDRMTLKIPVFGPIFRKATIARYSRTLGTMFGAGVPLVDALDAVAGASGNRVYYEAVQDIKTEVSTGRSLEASMTATGLFPNMVLQMVATGEESGELELMLYKVAEFYEAEVDDAVNAISSLIEPFMIVFLGIVVGTIVVAMYLPIFKLAAVF